MPQADITTYLSIVSSVLITSVVFFGVFFLYLLAPLTSSVKLRYNFLVKVVQVVQLLTYYNKTRG
jgi:hypothetical protein